MYSSRRGVLGGAKSATTCITLQEKIILADFNLAVSTKTAKPPYLIPHQIFWLYGTLSVLLKCVFPWCCYTIGGTWLVDFWRLGPSESKFRIWCSTSALSLLQCHSYLYRSHLLLTHVYNVLPLQGITTVLEFPLSLTISVPAQIPNWAIVADLTSTLSRIKRSPLQVGLEWN